MPSPRSWRNEYLPILCRPADICGGAVHHHLCHRVDFDSEPAGQRVPGSGASVGGRAHRLPRRQPQGDCRNRGHTAGRSHQWRRRHDVLQVRGGLGRRSSDDRHLPARHRRRGGHRTGAKPCQPGPGPAAGGGSATGRDHPEAVAHVPDGGAPDITERHLRYALPA